MKPQSQISRQLGSRRGDRMPAASFHKHPLTDFGYQTTGTDFSVRRSAKPFHSLSKEFLAEEMKRDYVREALCFLLIAGISVWPIVSMVQALALLK